MGGVLRHHKSEPSADALATCATKIGYYAYHLAKSENPAHAELVERFGKLRDLYQKAMDKQALGKWMAFERMGL